MLPDYIGIALEFAKGLVDTGIATEKNSRYIIKNFGVMQLSKFDVRKKSEKNSTL